MIFDPLLPDFNFYDGEETVTGGLNYYGAKLGNIFSTAFELETASKDLCLRFKQTWTDNMTLAETPVVEPYSGPNYTKNTFSPDLDKFRMDSLNKDTIALLSRRAFEVATSTPGVNVYLNDKPLPINNFKEYLDLCLKGKVDCLGAQLKCVFEAVNERWDIAVAVSEHGLQQISLANKCCTTKGGRHVDYITEREIKKDVKAMRVNLASMKNDRMETILNDLDDKFMC
ncbi:hypothetical protein DAPPUDRAFT_332921 [Daphnia pulex]|uniref:DNA topoisomerase (ATP-hydrolyzing) n=1 Tax=Daphnia pulex TaxID=6669 RepID=E9HRB9_DAPPU|nr:hypothetical protein DAPPUDRAFT_332921 [Daphnia pulex]|eukprot:EFX65673.1 hypothetical protein DAPPUDRAFT_332921 [Daphnia pulex]